MRQTPNNVAIRNALLAIGRSHVQMPGFDMGKTRELIAKLNQVCEGVRMIEVVVALAAILASSIDEPGATPQSWLARH
jgi:hypothetical protein